MKISPENTVVAMQAVPTTDVEEGKGNEASLVQHSKYELVSAVDPNERQSENQFKPPEMSWVNLNFSAGKATILKDCWGKVR